MLVKSFFFELISIPKYRYDLVDVVTNARVQRKTTLSCYRRQFLIMNYIRTNPITPFQRIVA